MRRLLNAIRILTVLSYFLPFVFCFTTCRGFSLYIAYNKEQAAKNEAIQENISSSGSMPDSTGIADSTMFSPDSSKFIHSNDSQVPAINTDTSNSISDKLFRAIVFPTSTSLSGVGVVYLYFIDEKLFMSVVVGASILLSLFIMVTGFSKKHNKRLLFILQLLNLVCIIAFIIDALFSSVTILFGAWTNFLLIIAGPVLTLKLKHKAKPVGNT